MDLNVVLRGQSNALLFADYGGIWEVERQLEAKLGGGDDVRILYQYYDPSGRNTINSGSSFMDWDTDGKQAGFMNYLNGQPESVQDNPTITLWMHNEFDQNSFVTTSAWVGEVRADAALVRGALGQGAATTPYLFTWVPYPHSQGDGIARLQTGMRQLAGDAAFNAELALNAMDGIAMDGDGYRGSDHMGRGDAQIVAGRLADALVPMARELGAGAGGLPTTPATPTPPSTLPANPTIGSGPDKLVLFISQDAYQGNAQYTVRVDGTQIGGTLSASALRSSGQHDTVTVLGDWGGGRHTATVTFLNDAWGGSAATDRNLYVESATYNGTPIAAAAGLFDAGSANVAFTDSDPVAPSPSLPPASPTVGSGPDRLVLAVSQDAYQGSAQYTVSVDGTQIGGTLTASAIRGSGQADTVTVLGNWAAGAHTVSVNFLNDAWGGSAATDRNLYVESATYNGAAVAGASAGLFDAGRANFGFTEAGATAPSTPPPTTTQPGTSQPATPTVGSGSDKLVLSVSQDAYQGSAQYTVSVDGAQIGGTLTASALHSSGQHDTVTVLGNWTGGAHTVSVNFLNDAWGGSAATDRNLYVDGATYNGGALAGAAAGLFDAGQASFRFTDSDPVVPNPSFPPATRTVGTGSDRLVLSISQDAYQGSAQYTVSVDGRQVGGTLTASALNASGQHDTVTVLGDWAAGNHTVAVNFLNDAWGGSATTDRNLYVDGATYNGATVAGAAAGLFDTGVASFRFLDPLG